MKRLQVGNVAFPDMQLITWTEDRIGQGVFYHRRELSESLLKSINLIEICLRTIGKRRKFHV